ncbi:hypothetical protein KSC_041510 [Ktedonobacter sp. SOSP1-52]|nr:hypothetical protein KSC_041510 [Ktedonobacter sp. SOSP1-52]
MIVTLLDRGIQLIKIREIRDIRLNSSNVSPDLHDCLIEEALAATGDVHVRALCNEALGCGKADAAVPTRDNSNFPFEFGHDCSLYS